MLSKISPYDPVGGGFGPQRNDGYGVAYFMEENCGEIGSYIFASRFSSVYFYSSLSVNFLITSFKSCSDTGSEKFAATLQKSVDDIKQLMESNSKLQNGIANGKTNH